MQQAELVAKPVEVTQHELHGSWCARCQEWHWPELPAAVQAGGLLGPRLSALAGYVKSQLHVSSTGVADLFDTVLGAVRRLFKVIHHKDELSAAEFAAALVKARRWVVEACHSWFNRFRKLLVRFEKTVASYYALCCFAAAVIIWNKTISR